MSESERNACVTRESRETQVHVTFDLDKGAAPSVRTGVGFFDHMLQLWAFHGQFGLTLDATGDLAVDDHHTVEDVGIVLGRAFAEAVAKQPIVRYGDTVSPMDEALVLVALDVSGRGVLAYEVPFRRERIGELSTENIREFWRSFCAFGGVNLHLRKLTGENDHHVAEAIFKGVGRALHQATRPSDRLATTKGVLD